MKTWFVIRKDSADSKRFFDRNAELTACPVLLSEQDEALGTLRKVMDTNVIIEEWKMTTEISGWSPSINIEQSFYKDATGVFNCKTRSYTK